MAENRGKKFESVIREAFEKVPNMSIDRLHVQTDRGVCSMGMKYDKDIESNPYLNDTGKYAVQFARNHQLPLDTIMSHPMIRTYAEVQSQLEQTRGTSIWQR